jgi:uncharacterized membrane protein
MATIDHSIDVKVPCRVAYDQWTQFEDFPQFMEGVRSVRQLDDRRVEWTAHMGGKDVTWQAEIFEQTPDRRVAWRSIGGARNAGTVTFEPRSAHETRVNVRIEYEPEGTAESVGEALGVVSRRVRGDLDRFKKFIEARGAPTGGWRGEIHGEDVRPEGSPPPANL